MIYVVLVTTFATLVIDAESGEQALEIASDAVSIPSGFELDEMYVDLEIDASRALRHVKASEWHRDNREPSPLKAVNGGAK